jgi:hypothetical protein
VVAGGFRYTRSTSAREFTHRKGYALVQAQAVTSCLLRGEIRTRAGRGTEAAYLPSVPAVSHALSRDAPRGPLGEAGFGLGLGSGCHFAGMKRAPGDHWGGH